MRSESDHGNAIRVERPIYWIGGAPGAGKSSVARLLAPRHGAWAYYCDWHQLGHEVSRTARIGEFPALVDWNRKSLDDHWVHSPPEQMARDVLAVWEERFPLVVADLDALSTGSCIVEGASCLPNQVLSVAHNPRNAVWLVPTPDFVRGVRQERYEQGESSALRTSDPPRALNNIIERDIILATVIQSKAARLGGAALMVDGTRAIESIVGEIEQRFGLVPLATYCGTYVDTRGRSVSIQLSGHALTLLSGDTRHLLLARGDQFFRLGDGPYIGESVRFEMNSYGEVSVVRMASADYDRVAP